MKNIHHYWNNIIFDVLSKYLRPGYCFISVDIEVHLSKSNIWAPQYSTQYNTVEKNELLPQILRPDLWM